MKGKKVIKAVKMIKKYCIKQNDCKKCPLSNKYGFCDIGKLTPDTWEIPKK